MKIQELLDSPEKWTKGCYAKDANGFAIDAENPEAVCWCLSGAIIKCYGDCNSQSSRDLYNRISSLVGEHFISIWNDKPETTFDAIREIITKLNV